MLRIHPPEQTTEANIPQSGEVEEEIIRRLIRDVVAPTPEQIKVPSEEEDESYRPQY